MMQNKKVIVIGLCGGAGSGKSEAAAELVRQTGAYHINTDLIAREQMKKGEASYLAVVKEFGNDILCDTGEIDRPKLAELVFSDEEKLKKLNSLTHARVTQKVKSIIEELKKKAEKKFVLLETAILLEAGYDSLCDEVWYIYASEATRRQRLSKTRGYSDEKIDELFKCQMKEQELRKRSNRVIINDTDDLFVLRNNIALICSTLQNKSF